MQTAHGVQRLAEVITLGDGAMGNIRTRIVELLAVADDSEGGSLWREKSLGVLYLYTINGEVIAIDTVLQVADDCCPHAVVGLGKLEGFAPGHGVATKAHLLGIGRIDAKGHLTATEIPHGLQRIIGCRLVLPLSRGSEAANSCEGQS